MTKYIIFGAVLISLLAIISWQNERIRVISAERENYRQNTYSLLADVETYKTENGLNAAKTGVLSLALDEYKRFRADDYKLIESLRVDKKRLQSIIASQTQTIYNFEATVRDSVVPNLFTKPDSISFDTLKCIDISDRWFEMHGCMSANSKFNGTFISVDSLVCVDHIVPKKFLFIKFGIKSRNMEIVSRNPHTRVLNVEYVKIKH